MPKNTFYNLSEEKKSRIIKACYGQFSQKSYDRVTIRDIVDEAGIPIGSFYQYFEDKDDLYMYALNNIENRIYKELKNKVDLYEDMIIGSASEEFIKSVLTEEELCFDRTFLTLPDEKLEKFYFNNFNELLYDEYRDFFTEMREQGKLKDDVDLEFILHMYITSMFNILMYFKKKNILIFEEQKKIKKYFYHEIFLKSIMKD